jgi:hypothetical protein
MRSHVVRMMHFAVDEIGRIFVLLALAAAIVSVPAHAQDSIWQVDAGYLPPEGVRRTAHPQTSPPPLLPLATHRTPVLRRSDTSGRSERAPTGEPWGPKGPRSDLLALCLWVDRKRVIATPDHCSERCLDQRLSVAFRASSGARVVLPKVCARRLGKARSCTNVPVHRAP